MNAGSTRKAAFKWDALGRRVESWNDLVPSTTRYWYDGVNEIHSDRLDGDAFPQPHTPMFFVHGVSYIDEQLAMIATATNTRLSDAIELRDPSSGPHPCCAKDGAPTRGARKDSRTSGFP